MFRVVLCVLRHVLLTISDRCGMVFKRPWHLLHNLFCLCVFIPAIVHFLLNTLAFYLLNNQFDSILELSGSYC